MKVNKVVCIDDDAITLMLSKMVLKKALFCEEVITLNHGEEAIRYFENLVLQNETSNYPKLLFLDLNMPIMNGWEFLESFTQKGFSAIFKDIKVVVLSSTIDPKDIEKASQYPIVFRFLSKPINKSMLENLKSIL